jgi:hypothetical protein
VPAGGVGMLNGIGGPLPDVTFCPTGGISIETAPQFLKLKNVACVGGSWLTPKDLMANGEWDKITELAKAASAALKQDRPIPAVGRAGGPNRKVQHPSAALPLALDEACSSNGLIAMPAPRRQGQHFSCIGSYPGFVGFAQSSGAV